MKKLLFLAVGALMMLNSCKEDPIEPTIDTVLVGTLTQDKTLTADKVWTLKGYVYVPEGVTLTIEAGTTIKSDIAEKGALCIERGGKIMAEGTADKPIVFTSGQASPAPGDWGGVILLGKATTNRTTEPTIEGGIGRPYGGNDDNDNSGVLKYVRVEYAGIAAFPNSEINAFTFGAVGSGTTVEFCESYYGNDDAFEFFGGTVSPKYLVAVGTADDDYDFDFGYRGTIQYAISKRDPQFVDGADAGNGIECDNDGTGSSATPTTHPTLLNFTLIGPATSNAAANHNLAMRWRRASQFTVVNSIFYGYLKGGLSLESDETAQAFKDGVSKFVNNYVSAVDTAKLTISKSSVIASSEMPGIASTSTFSTSQVAPFNNMFESTTNIGAIPFGTVNWLLGWTKF
jgi:hypothetical protein